MSESLPTVYLARHGETAWSLSGPAYRTHRPAADRARRARMRARSARGSRGMTFAQVFTSPLQRAARRARSRASAASPRSTPTSSSGTTATTKGRRRARSSPASGLATVPRRLPRRRIAGGRRRARRPRGAADPRRRRQRARVLERAHPARAGARWLGLRRRRRPLFRARHASLSALGYEHDRSRAGDPLLERHAAARRTDAPCTSEARQR